LSFVRRVRDEEKWLPADGDYPVIGGNSDVIATVLRVPQSRNVLFDDNQ
jgi:hypothetical protein